MPHITLKFAPEMWQAIYEGRKCCTTRSEVKGKIGDTFVIGGRDYRIVDVQPNWLGEIRGTLFHQEGFDSPEAFETFWTSLHRGEFTPLEIYHTHWFARIEQGADAQ